ncbi:thioredoxin family protein [Aurantiacibacter aquimixticola]|uniref:Thioredoxin family protein n=1 Tax=Aurantiacibacter aquimixticola TaxID=1958945 RepID=A0A419RTX3_9SPHN|nr:thioredoxin family protein [Aurantiacibacter aquimixticola]RJY09235.1 thioredoxin family protein [Aurantiacibacter aquimixticola]
MKRLAVLATALALTGCTTAHHDYPEATPYTESANAMAEVDAALLRATAADKRVLLVMGADWCHDSRALAGWLETPRLAALVEKHYELLFVNAGTPQTSEGSNLDIARRFGIADLPGTPNVFVLTPSGALVNTDTVTTWRNAASRSEDAIYAELAELAVRPVYSPVPGAEIAE